VEFTQNGCRYIGKTAEFMAKKSMEKSRAESKNQEVTLYKRTGGAKFGAALCMIFGYLCGGGLGIALFVMLIVLMTLGSLSGGVFITIGVLLPLFLISAGFAIGGNRQLSMLKRFERYISCLNGKTYGNLQDFSSSLHKSEDYVRRDLEKMLEKGWFLQGHFDQEKTCLITSHDTYQNYVGLKEQLEQKRAEQEKRRAAGITPEAEEAIREGRKFIDEIHRCNEQIPGEEISRKIADMEEVINKIFNRIEQYPEMVGDIRKLMEYYLPTTVKLLHAYEELDGQSVQGENILSSKKEIEESLDTLNIAFEKLLDSLFQEQAWDVSSDISVLKTMLAQDGLTKKEF
jgi:5-bromo-4-chloroindolyl phosphate hydrolysis protein